MILVEPPLSNIGKRERVLVTVNHKVVKDDIDGRPTEIHFFVGDYKDAKSSAILNRNLASWRLSCVGTKPEFQRQGLSRQVINAVKVYVKLHSATSRIRLDTTSVIARDFYESEGFKVFAQEPRQVFDGRQWVAYGFTWHMVCNIRERDLT